MTEYVAVVRKAIGELENNRAETRRAVYSRLRRDLIEELRAINPPLGVGEISVRRLELEEAIRHVERESVANVSLRQAPQHTGERRQEPTAVIRPIVPPADDLHEEENGHSQAVYPIVEMDSGSRATEASGSMERAAVAIRVEPPRDSAADIRLTPDGAVDYAPLLVTMPQKLDAPPSRDWSVGTPAINPPRRPLPASPRIPDRYLSGDDLAEAIERDERSWWSPFRLLTVLISAVILAALTLAWSKRAMIEQIITALDSDGVSTKAIHSVTPTVENGASPSALVDSPGSHTPTLPAGAGPQPVQTGAPAELANRPSPAAPPQISGAADDDAVGTPLEKNATLREEPLTGDSNAPAASFDALVTWRFVGNGAHGPAIVADLQVPARHMKLKMTIHKNTDGSIPASHLIEIAIDAPADPPGKGIQQLSPLQMKPTEEARGHALVGAEAKIVDGLFWIALSAAAPDLSANLALLRDREWIDIPLVYQTGQRAFLTFAKGPQGDQVFQKALAAWG